jgi:hypothetical protein
VNTKNDDAAGKHVRDRRAWDEKENGGPLGWQWIVEGNRAGSWIYDDCVAAWEEQHERTIDEREPLLMINRCVRRDGITPAAQDHGSFLVLPLPASLVATAHDLLFGPAKLAAKIQDAVTEEDARYAKAVEAMAELIKLNPLPVDPPK